MHQDAFETFRAALTTPPMLMLFDPLLPSRVGADASGVAIGGVLTQEEKSVWRPGAYYSRKLSTAEQRYPNSERGCLAIEQCLVQWQHYFLGAPFQVL